VIEGEKVAVD